MVTFTPAQVCTPLAEDHKDFFIKQKYQNTVNHSKGIYIKKYTNLLDFYMKWLNK